MNHDEIGSFEGFYGRFSEGGQGLDFYGFYLTPEKLCKWTRGVPTRCLFRRSFVRALKAGTLKA